MNRTTKKDPTNPNERTRSRALRLIALKRRRKAEQRFLGALLKAQQSGAERRVIG